MLRTWIGLVWGFGLVALVSLTSSLALRWRQGAPQGAPQEAPQARSCGEAAEARHVCHSKAGTGDVMGPCADIFLKDAWSRDVKRSLLTCPPFANQGFLGVQALII